MNMKMISCSFSPADQSGQSFGEEPSGFATLYSQLWTMPT
jgi:hypothetical protein